MARIENATAFSERGGILDYSSRACEYFSLPIVTEWQLVLRPPVAHRHRSTFSGERRTSRYCSGERKVSYEYILWLHF